MTAPSPHMITISMRRDDLEGCPRHELPPPLRLRWYRPGDEDAWVAIWRTDRWSRNTTPEAFAREFHGDIAELRRRMCFIAEPAGRLIGTATGWLADDGGRHDDSFGRVHWVALLPEYRGRGLARCMMTAVMDRLRELGHTRAFLLTQPPRLAAIRLYLRFGFRPDVRSQEELAAWEGIRRRLSPGPMDEVELRVGGL